MLDGWQDWMWIKHVFSLLQLSDTDQRIYKNFNLVVQDRWQEEMMGK